MLEYLNNLCILLTMKVNNFIEEEKGAVDLVTIVVLIGIAIVLAVLFRDRITALLNTLFDILEGNAVNAMGGG